MLLATLFVMLLAATPVSAQGNSTIRDSTQTKIPSIAKDSFSEKNETTKDQPGDISANPNEPPDGYSGDGPKKYALPGYKYVGDPCGTPDKCGLKSWGWSEMEHSMECAAYETQSAKQVFGCTYPRSGYPSISVRIRENCIAMIFLYHSKPYNSLDTCSGERLYPPPEPPSEKWTYWHPTKPKYARDNPHKLHLSSEQCWQERPLRRFQHCELRNIPSRWECEVYYYTVYGSIRGCHDSSKERRRHPDRRYISELRLYDEVGRLIDVVEWGARVSDIKCGEEKCGVKEKVPSKFECWTVEYRWGKLYGGEIVREIDCESPDRYKYLNGELPSDYDKTCEIVFNEKRKKLYRGGCGPPQGDGGIVTRTGPDADKADKTLNEDRTPKEDSPTGGIPPTPGTFNTPLGNNSTNEDNSFEDRSAVSTDQRSATTRSSERPPQNSEMRASISRNKRPRVDEFPVSSSALRLAVVDELRRTYHVATDSTLPKYTASSSDTNRRASKKISNTKNTKDPVSDSIKIEDPIVSMSKVDSSKGLAQTRLSRKTETKKISTELPKSHVAATERSKVSSSEPTKHDVKRNQLKQKVEWGHWGVPLAALCSFYSVFALRRHFLI